MTPPSTRSIARRDTCWRLSVLDRERLVPVLVVLACVEGIGDRVPHCRWVLGIDLKNDAMRSWLLLLGPSRLGSGQYQCGDERQRECKRQQGSRQPAPRAQARHAVCLKIA